MSEFELGGVLGCRFLSSEFRHFTCGFRKWASHFFLEIPHARLSKRIILNSANLKFNSKIYLTVGEKPHIDYCFIFQVLWQIMLGKTRTAFFSGFAISSKIRRRILKNATAYPTKSIPGHRTQCYVMIVWSIIRRIELPPNYEWEIIFYYLSNIVQSKMSPRQTH